MQFTSANADVVPKTNEEDFASSSSIPRGKHTNTNWMVPKMSRVI